MTPAYAEERPAIEEPWRQNAVTRFAQNRPLTFFLLWFFTIGQVIAFIPVVLNAHGHNVSSEPFIIASTWIGLLLPTVFIKHASSGAEGVKELLSRACHFRTPVRWYALVLVAVPVGILAIQVLAAGLPDVTVTDWIEAIALGFVVNCAVVFVTVNWAEEIVWTGLVQGTWQSRGWSTFRAAAAAAPLFALQHISLAAGEGLAGGATFLALILVFSIPFRALQGWIYNRTGSLALPGLVHAAGNAAALGSILSMGTVPRLYDQDGQSVLVFAVYGLLVIALTRGRLGRDAKAVPHTE